MKKRKLSEEEEKEIEESKEFIRSIVEEGSKNIPKTNGELVLKIRELRELITEIEEYKNYDKYIAEAEAERRKTEEAFNRWRTKRRFEKFFRASIRKAGMVSEHKKVNLEELEKKLTAFEPFLDKKYWKSVTLGILEIIAIINCPQTIEEAVAEYEKSHT